MWPRPEPCNNAMALSNWYVWKWVHQDEVRIASPIPTHDYFATDLPVSPNTPFSLFLLVLTLGADALLLYLLFRRRHQAKRAAAASP